MTAQTPNREFIGPRAHQSFIDWMKAAGMFLIVFGHLIGPPFNQFTQPIYPKQLGVAFFVFIAAWGLANDSRPRLRVLFNRLFPVYLFGIAIALCLSIILLITKNTANLSNYEPFVLGVNVLFNNFPANPTTWYIGTYIHILLFWAFFFQGKTIKKIHVVIAFICEISIRSLLMASGKLYIAYMLLPNWLTVFLLGMYLARKQDSKDRSKLIFLVPLWLGIFALWAFCGNSTGFDLSFPFRNMITVSQSSVVVRSILISLVYFIHTLLFFEIARRLPPLPVVSFLARNTLIIFIVHMPLIENCSAFVYSFFQSVFLEKLTWGLTLYIGLAASSEAVNRLIKTNVLREKVWLMVNTQLKVLKGNAP